MTELCFFPLFFLFLRYLRNCTGVVEEEPFTEDLHHGESGTHPGAMRYTKLLDIEFFKRGDRPFDLLFFGVKEMAPADNGVDFLYAGDFLCVQ